MVGQMSMLPLSAVVQKYAWGKVGNTSTVAQLLANDRTFELDSRATYAELWMGTHSKAPAIIRGVSADVDGTSLLEYLNSHSELLGADTVNRFGKSLPFLFKVLSINKSLSIQAHPSKDHARILHEQRPDIYPDPNHKPEMAIALTKFEALCGFRPVTEILDFLNEVPELLAVVGQKAADDLISSFHCCATDQPAAIAAALRCCFKRVMKCTAAHVKSELLKLVDRIESCHDSRVDTSAFLGKLLLRIHSQFPGDVGCFVIYFLNFIELEPFEAMFLGPNLPHAYLSGDCVECMACSDNVVRAGLTPKYKDVDTLINMLDYTQKDAASNLFVPSAHPDDANTILYNPPVDDFAVDMVTVSGGKDHSVRALQSASILLVVAGEASAASPSWLKVHPLPLTLQQGSVVFIGVGETVQLTNVTVDMLIFRAYCKP